VGQLVTPEQQTLFTPPPSVVGLDLSLTAAGIAHAKGVVTVGEDGHKGATLTERRQRLSRQTARVLEHVLDDNYGEEWAEVAPVVVALERPAQHMNTGSAHDRSGLWWQVVHQLSAWPNVHVVEVGIASVKLYATGKGNSGKVAVASAASDRFRITFADDNQADAFVLRAMALDHYGMALTRMPARNREALAAVDWPVLEAVAA
jgi:hypothetical protein